MRRILKRTAACAFAALTVALAGCSDTSWSLKIDGEKIPAGMYIFTLMNSASSIKSGLSSTSSGDVWSQKIGSTDAKTYAINEAVKQTTQFVVVERLCKKYKLTLSSSEKSSVDKMAVEAVSGSSGTYQSHDVSSESVKRVYEDYSLANKLLDYLYGDKGVKKISDSDLAKYEKDYLRVKHILFTDKDSSGNTLTGSKLKEVTDKANKVLAEVKKDPSKFDADMKKYSEDTGGLQQYPDGYTFKKDSTNFIEEFVKGANSMKIGEIKLVHSTYGYHILQRLQLDKTTMKNQYAQELFGKYLEDAASKVKVERNSDTINAYSPDKL